MKYYVITQFKNDEFIESFPSSESAIDRANYDWEHMSAEERKNCRQLEVVSAESFCYDGTDSVLAKIK